MEIDDLKEVWKDAFNGKKKLSDQEIERRLKLRSRSESVLRKIKRSYLIELAVFILIIPVIYKGLFDLNFTKFNVGLIVIITVFLVLIMQMLIRKYLDARRVNLMDESVKINLMNVIESVDRYISFNVGIFSKFILFPLAMFLGLYIGMMLGAEEESFLELWHLLGTRIFYLFGIVAIIYAVYLLYVNRLYKALYGRYLDELKSLYTEFEDIA